MVGIQINSGHYYPSVAYKFRLMLEQFSMFIISGYNARYNGMHVVLATWEAEAGESQVPSKK
jgi:hypothetical protein